VQQDVGTIHPVDMRHHGLEAVSGHFLKPEMLLDTFMKRSSVAERYHSFSRVASV
jgi:hypothetical protein